MNIRTMTGEKEDIAYLDYMLILVGNMMYNRGKLLSFVNFTCRIMFLIIYYHQLYVRIGVVMTSEKITVLYHFSNMSYIIVIILFQHHTWYYRTQLRTMYEQLILNLTKFDQLKFRRLVISSFLVNMLYTLLEVTLNLVVSLTDSDADGYVRFNRTVYLVDVAVRHLLGIWIPCSCAIYILYYHLIYFTKLDNLMAFERKLKNGIAIIANETVRLQEISDYGNEFNAILKLYPTMWLLSILLQTSGYIVLFREEVINWTLLVTEWILLGMQAFTCTLTIAIVVYRNSQLDEQISTLRKRITTVAGDRLSNGHLMLINELERPLVLTGCGQFEIKSSLLVSFFGSMITFSVLFVQLTG